MRLGASILILGAIAVCVVVVATAGQPVPFGVVTSGSMSPTLDPGDVYLAIPPAIVGGVERGDIAIFHGQSGWTVHRVVDVTPHGYVTRGDGTPLTDQDVGSPPIPSRAVVGVVPEVRARPLVVPGALGGETAVRTAVLCVGLLVASTSLEGDRDGWVPAPWMIGGLVAVAVVVSWLLGSIRPTPPAAGAITNSGYVPFIVIREFAETAMTVDLLWPGSSVDLQTSERHATIFGVAPPSVISPALDRDVRLAVGLVAGCTGAFAWLVASATTRVLPPDRP